MKSIFRACVFAFASAVALAACGAGQANAATLTQNFVGDSGNVFQVNDALSFKQVSGAVQVVAANGTTYAYPDATGALFTKLVNATHGFYVNVPGTLEYMNTISPIYILCYSGSQSGFAYAGAIPARFIPDGCGLFNTIKSQSN